MFKTLNHRLNTQNSMYLIYVLTNIIQNGTVFNNCCVHNISF